MFIYHTIFPEHVIFCSILFSILTVCQFFYMSNYLGMKHIDLKLRLSWNASDFYTGYCNK